MALVVTMPKTAGEEGIGGTIDTRILEEMRDISCKFFDVLPTPAENVANGQRFDLSTKNIQIILSTVLTC